MKLSKIQITGFQSFRDSGEIEFGDGINLIVGQNNSGKSSLLRALQPNLRDDRNRSPDQWENHILPNPNVILTVKLSGIEYKKILLRSKNNIIPTPSGSDLDSYLKSLFSKNVQKFKIVKNPGEQPKILFEDAYGIPYNHYIHIASHNGEITIQGSTNSNIYEPQIISYYITSVNTFHFNAERMSIGESAHSHAERLTENANNLPSVLMTLQGERGDTFNKLIQHLREIFPTVGNMSVGPVYQNSNIEVRIWPTQAMQRRELSFSLNNSGTGVAQVIAILTAVMTIEQAVIVIDEVNSFLHPAAVKTLLRILQTEYNQHQYIISTHSPEVISFSNPSTVHLVKRNGYESTVHRLNINQIDDFREVADHLGISMADVFAADNVIWVEGPTEELCFPLVYSHSTNTTLPPGTAFISVVATGDLSRKKRDRQLVGEIYERLSSTGSPLVKSCLLYTSDAADD